MINVFEEFHGLEIEATLSSGTVGDSSVPGGTYDELSIEDIKVLSNGHDVYDLLSNAAIRAIEDVVFEAAR